MNHQMRKSERDKEEGRTGFQKAWSWEQYICLLTWGTRVEEVKFETERYRSHIKLYLTTVLFGL